jgi:hypothetical protein
MQIISISPSAFNKFTECQMKYFFEYVLKYRSDPGDAAKAGTATHLFLEFLALLKKAHQEKKEKIELPIGETEALDPFDIDIDDLFDKTFRYFSEKEGLPESFRDEVYKNVMVALESDDDPRKNTVVATEQYFSIEIPLPWASYTYSTKDEALKGSVRINGIIDLIYQTGPDTYRIVDWKTNKSRKDWVTGKMKEYADFQEDIQLNTYNMVVRHLYPEVPNFEICIFFLKAGGPFDYVFPESAIAGTLKEFKTQINKIRETGVPKQNKSFRCKWCPFYQMKLDNAPVETRAKQFDEIGEKMCACSQIHQEIKKDGINVVVDKYKKK